MANVLLADHCRNDYFVQSTTISTSITMRTSSGCYKKYVAPNPEISYVRKRIWLHKKIEYRTFWSKKGTVKGRTEELEQPRSVAEQAGLEVPATDSLTALVFSISTNWE